VKSDGERSFIRKLADLIVQEVNQEYGNDNTVTVHLINSIMNMIETEIYYSKYSKNKFDKKKILYLVLNKCFENKYAEDDTMIEDSIRYIIDNKLIKLNKKNLFIRYAKKALKFGLDVIM
jgi:hypothetical protein